MYIRASKDSYSAFMLYLRRFGTLVNVNCLSRVCRFVFNVQSCLELSTII